MARNTTLRFLAGLRAKQRRVEAVQALARESLRIVEYERLIREYEENLIMFTPAWLQRRGLRPLSDQRRQELERSRRDAIALFARKRADALEMMRVISTSLDVAEERILLSVGAIIDAVRELLAAEVALRGLTPEATSKVTPTRTQRASRLAISHAA